MSAEVEAAVIAGVMSSVIAVAIFIAQSIQSGTQQRLAAQQDIVGKYDALVQYRTQFPWVLSQAGRWKSEFWADVYEDDSEEPRHAIYYGYAELITLYVTAVLHARSQKLIDENVYVKQHKRLITLLLTENYPIMSDLCGESGFASGYICDFFAELERVDGRDWAHEHAQVISGA